jgi:hypothetical protein
VDSEKLKLEELGSRYKENIFFLAKDCLGYKDITVDFHYKYLCRKLMEPRKKKIRLFLIPRGHFKTTLLTITDCIRMQINEPSIRIAIISAVLANASSMLNSIGSVYLTNQLFRQLYPQWCPRKPHSPETKWTNTEIHIPNRGGKPVMEGTFEAFGADSTLTSRHFDYIKIDDLVTRENSTTKEQMEKCKDFYRAVFPLCDSPQTPVDVIGTRWDDNDLYGDLENDPDVELIKISAETNGVPIFPQRYPIEELRSIKRKLGSYLYSCLYQQDPIPQEDAIFRERYFKYFRLTPDRKEIIREDGATVRVGDCYMTIDAATEEGKNDFSSILVATSDYENNIYFLDCFNKQSDPVKFLDVLVEMYFKWSCIKFGGQKAVVEKMLMSFLRKKMRDERIYLSFMPLGANTRMNKEFSIKQLQPWYEGGFVWHNELMRDGDLENQLLRFPKAKHDDLADVAQMMLEVIKPSSKFVQTKDYDRNSIYMWKRRLRRALGKYPSEATEAYIDSRTY